MSFRASGGRVRIALPDASDRVTKSSSRVREVNRGPHQRPAGRPRSPGNPRWCPAAPRNPSARLGDSRERMTSGDDRSDFAAEIAREGARTGRSWRNRPGSRRGTGRRPRSGRCGNVLRLAEHRILAVGNPDRRPAGARDRLAGSLDAHLAGDRRMGYPGHRRAAAGFGDADDVSAALAGSGCCGRTGPCRHRGPRRHARPSGRCPGRPRGSRRPSEMTQDHGTEHVPGQDRGGLAGLDAERHRAVESTREAGSGSRPRAGRVPRRCSRRPGTRRGGSHRGRSADGADWSRARASRPRIESSERPSRSAAASYVKPSR